VAVGFGETEGLDPPPDPAFEPPEHAAMANTTNNAAMRDRCRGKLMDMAP
jgi:hypothetical protein